MRLEHKQAEEALRASEERYKGIFSCTKSGVAVYQAVNSGQDFIFSDFNNGAEKIERIKRSDLIGKSVLEMFPGVKDFGLFDVLKRVWQTGRPEHHPVALYTDDRISGWRENYVYKLASGEVVAVYSDETKRRQVEEALQESEQKLRAIFDQTFEFIFLLKIDGTLIDANRAALKFVETKIKDVLGKPFWETIWWAHSAELQRHLKQAVQTAASGHFARFEAYHPAVDGHIHYFDVSIKPVKDKADNVILLIPESRDITERKQAEEALRKSEQKYRGIFDESITAVYLFDEKKNFMDSNQAGLDLLGYSKEELLNMSISDVDADPIIVLPAHEQVLGGKRIINYEHRLKQKDGNVITVLNNSRPITDTNGHVVGMQSTLIDITKRKKAQDDLRIAHHKLEQRVRERTKDLELKAKSLEEVNTAMEVLLKKRAADKIELENNVLTNIRKLIAPYFEKIKKTRLDNQQEAFLNILESNLNEIVSPFTQRFSLKYLDLTPRELMVADLIKHGDTTKKIAKIMNISPRTVETHRKNIRKKIGLEKKRANLRSHLLAFN